MLELMSSIGIGLMVIGVLIIVLPALWIVFKAPLIHLGDKSTRKLKKGKYKAYKLKRDNEVFICKRCGTMHSRSPYSCECGYYG